jgi:hypothetical protein
MVAGTVNRRSRNRLGSHQRAGWVVRASISHPGGDLDREGHDGAPDLVLLEVEKGECAQAGVFGDPDPVFAAGPASVTDLEVGQLGAGPTGPSVGRERGDAVADDER